ncbi:MAG: 4Fe-4S binding protein [Nitrospinae bacterium]|nr:4Fe-4S binding protein [Nitrospinota bacterium]
MGDAKTQPKKTMHITVDHNLDEVVKKKVAVSAEISGKNEKGKIDFHELKSGGFIKQRQKDKFTVRLRCPSGRMEVSKLKQVAESAEKFGGKYVHFTVRQSLEIPYVDYHNFAPLIEELKTVGQDVASCGPRVRVPNACGGCEYNPNGLVDAAKISDAVNVKFFGMRTAHKFKSSFSACPIDCMRTTEADLGMMGAVFPKWDEDKCTGCTICASACTEDAIKAHPETGKPIFTPDNCVYCADCIRACPTFSWTADKTGHNMRVGGRHGRHPLGSTMVARFLTDEEALTAIEATIKWYQKAGEGKGRIRIGEILRQEGQMGSLMEALKTAVGPEKLVKNPEPPTETYVSR